MKKKKICTFDNYFLLILGALFIMEFTVSYYLPDKVALLISIGWGIFSVGGVIIGTAHLWILRGESWKYKEAALGLIIAGLPFLIIAFLMYRIVCTISELKSLFP